jgi:hypothetical protein
MERVMNALAGELVTASGGWNRTRAVCHGGDNVRPGNLAFKQGRSGVTFRCHSRDCSVNEVAEALGLAVSDLFDFQNAPQGGSGDNWVPCQRADRGGHRKIAEYVYTDADENVIHGVTRCDHKCFAQWRPDDSKRSGRAWKMNDEQGKRLVPLIPYRLPDLLAAVGDGLKVYLVEGEKDADNLWSVGAPATCNAGGAGKWTSEHAKYLSGAHVVIIRDRDQPGHDHAALARESLAGVAASVVIVEARQGKDASDHLDAGYGVNDFVPVRENPYMHTEGEPLDRIPAALWSASGVLSQIKQAADAVLCSPDATLFASVARLSALIGPNVRVDTGIGRPATLCWFSALFATSGGGKGQAEDTADLLVPHPVVRDLANIKLSTGQGITAAYLSKVKDEMNPKEFVIAQTSTRGYAWVPEGKLLGSLTQQAGSTLDGVLCSAWMSEQQGASNATVELRRELPKGSYTFSMNIAAQQDAAEDVLAMSGIGLPQRLAWVHASRRKGLGYSRRPAMPGPLMVTSASGEETPLAEWAARKDVFSEALSLPAEATAELEILIEERGEEGYEGNPLDAHEPLWRAKCAALLALMHGYSSVKADHWNMAEALWGVSCKVRDGIAGKAKARLAAQAAALRAEHVRTAVETDAALAEQRTGVHPAVVGVARRIHAAIVKAGEPVPVTELTRNCVSSKERAAYRSAGHDQPIAPAALAYATAEGWVRPAAVAGLLTIGQNRP